MCCGILTETRRPLRCVWFPVDAALGLAWAWAIIRRYELGRVAPGGLIPRLWSCLIHEFFIRSLPVGAAIVSWDEAWLDPSVVVPVPVGAAIVFLG